ncbi:hypothetical protein [Actinophytocola sp. KF-1]
MTGKRERIILYSVVGALLVVLAAVGVVTWRGARETRDAQAKADRLVAALVELGATAPDRDQVVRVLGTDGGRVCADPSGALNRAAQLGGMTNGAGGPGTRPVLADSELVQGELAIIAIYCPGELSEFQEFVDDLRTAELTDE